MLWAGDYIFENFEYAPLQTPPLVLPDHLVDLAISRHVV